QVVLDVGPDPPREVAAQPPDHPADHRQGQQQGDLAPQHPRDPLGQPVVDDRPDDQRDVGGDGQHDDPEAERHRHPLPVGRGQPDDAPQRPEGEAVGRRVGSVPAQRAAPTFRGRVTHTPTYGSAQKIRGRPGIVLVHSEICTGAYFAWTVTAISGPSGPGSGDCRNGRPTTGRPCTPSSTRGSSATWASWSTARPMSSRPGTPGSVTRCSCTGPPAAGSGCGRAWTSASPSRWWTGWCWPARP